MSANKHFINLNYLHYGRKKLSESLFQTGSIFRKTGEEVEIIAFENKEKGARSEDDWVSYIDSKGEEHIKEHLNIEFDFKPIMKLPEFLAKILGTTSPVPKFDLWESRRHEIIKGLIIKRKYSLDKAIKYADEIITRLKLEVEDIKKQRELLQD